MSDRRGYPTAYRRSALPQHVRQRGFQPLPMLPVAPRTPLRVGKYARWAGRLARLHPAVRALSTALDLLELMPGQIPVPGTEFDIVIPGYNKLTSSCPGPDPLGSGPVYQVQASPSCGFPAFVRRSCAGSGATILHFSFDDRTNPASAPSCSQLFRARYFAHYQRIPGADPGPIEYVPARPGTIVTVPTPSRRGVPQPLPELLPPGRPSPGVDPIPYPLIPGRVPNPNRSPTEQSEWGNDVPPLIPEPVVPTPGVIVLPTPGNPSPEPSPSPQPDTPFPGPPATTRTRERKVILAVAGVPARIVSAATETKDVIDAFWSAMPEQFQRAHKFRYGRLTRPHEKALLIWENLDELDIGAAITNLAWEQLEDMAYGRLGKLQARAARKRRAMHGFTLGPAL